MTTLLTTPNRVSRLEARVANLESELRDCRDGLRELEKRLDQDDAIRDKLREIAAPYSALGLGLAEPK